MTGKRSVCVTGAEGFIGSYLTEHFVREGGDPPSQPAVTPNIESYSTSARAQYTVQLTNPERLIQAGIPTAVICPIPLNKQPAVVAAAVQPSARCSNISYGRRLYADDNHFSVRGLSKLAPIIFQTLFGPKPVVSPT
jgi:hypothetical protein